MSIHPTAVVDPGAELGANVVIRPFTVVEADVRVGDDCNIGPHAVIRSGTRMGDRNTVSVGAVLGDDPQDRKYQGEQTYLEIGHDNIIREYATLHRASGEGTSTVVGDDCMIMAYSHVGHNARVGNGVTMANLVQLAGHATVDDFTVMGGMAGLHQFARVGRMCMIGAGALVRIDVPPYMLADGSPAVPKKLNIVGLRRRDTSQEAIEALRRAFRLLYRSEMNTQDALTRVRQEVEMLPEIVELVEFLERIPLGERGRQNN